MKRAVLILSVLSVHLMLFAQHNPVKVAGSVGVAYVNISVLNTRYGTSSDAEGRYELLLFDRNKPVDLLYTCIGYRDTVVSLTPRMLQHDSVGISFVMRRTEYDLQEVGVSASRDFYRNGRSTYIADIAFANGKILVLENKKQSVLTLLDGEGDVIASTAFSGNYDELYTDCFGNPILIGQDSCLQVYFDEKGKALPVSVFTNDQYRDKIRKVVFEFNDGYLFRNTAYEKRDFYVKDLHGQAQTYSYVLKNDTLKRKHFLHRFIDSVAVESCQSYLNEIFALYYAKVPENENEILLGIWNGNLLRLAIDYQLHFKIAWYCQIQATEYHTTALKFEKFMQLIDLEKYEMVEVDKDFQITRKRPLKVVSGEKYFNNRFLTDGGTGKTYGLFVKDGMNYLGLYDPESGTVGMGQKACREAYPRVFKVHGGYAYSVYFDRERQYGRINRMKID